MIILNNNNPNNNNNNNNNNNMNQDHYLTCQPTAAGKKNKFSVLWGTSDDPRVVATFFQASRAVRDLERIFVLELFQRPLKHVLSVRILIPNSWISVWPEDFADQITDEVCKLPKKSPAFLENYLNLPEFWAKIAI